MNTDELTELTEFSDLSADELHFVKRAANGFPALLAKSVAEEIGAAKSKSDIDALAERIYNPTELANYWRLVKHQETPMKRSKLEKTAKRSLSKSVRQIYALRKSEAAVKAVENATLTRIAQLERLAKSQSGQDSYGTAFELHRLRSSLGHLALAKAGLPAFDNFDHVDAYLANPNPAAAGAASSRASTARAISSAQGDPINQHLGRQSPLDVMRDILNDRGEPESVRDFEVQTRKLEKALADATSPQERESLGYQVTRRKLLAMHARGEG